MPVSTASVRAGSSMVSSVVFLRIQDFARRPASEQARLRAQLQAAVAVAAAEIPPAERIVLDASDGLAIVVLDRPAAALALAQRALSAVAVGLPLSAGVNHGTLQLTGRKGGDGMTGDGIAVAASVAEFAAPPKLLASRAFRDALADAAPGAEAVLVPAGTFADAGLRTHELFAPDARAPGRRRRRYALASAAAVVALLAGGVTLRAANPAHVPILDLVLERAEPYWREVVHRVNGH